MSKYNWTRNETKDLITLYEVNECLWNKHLREYKDRDERVSSIQSISDEMKIPIDEINKKIHNLRNQYRFELNKMKKNFPGKSRYQTKWPYFKNLSFLENIVSVRGSSNQQDSNNDFNDGNEFTMEAENSNEKLIGRSNEATIVTTTEINNEPQQIFHVSVEYEEDPKPKSEVTQNTRKRRTINKDVHDVFQQSAMNHYPSKTSNTIVKQASIIIDDNKPQDNDIKVDDDQVISKSISNEKTKFDKFEVFGMFVANEMRSLSSVVLQNKFKKKILECILEINDSE